jgi:creatinine amidohydrolase/Fe(II)-dependent formamide hydrolase-like protein
VLGDPAGASVDEGRALLDALVRDLTAAVASRWSPQ